MLPKELLEVKRVKGKVYPRFADKRDYELAEKIIDLFQKSKGRKYGKILEALKKLESPKNFRKVRGLVRVMEKLCIEKACAFDVSTDVPELEPLKVRMLLFEKGYVTSKKEREKVIEFAARYFNTTPENIEKAMYADREEELVIVNVKQITPNELIRFYNLSLLQTAIFNSVRVTFWTSSNHKEIFRRIKWLGLMYELFEEENGRILVEVTGTASILKMTRRYGTSMAKLIPSILKAENWWIRAEIIEGSRIYILEMDSRKKDLFPAYDEKIEYDSSLEEEFSWKLRSLGYEVIREPDILKAGKTAFIPDFMVRKGENKVYIEIAGFWTPEYIQKKIEKIRESNVPLVLIANREFGSIDGFLKGDWDRKEVSIIFYSEKLPYNLILREISKLLKKQMKEELSQELKEVVDLKKLSEISGISVKEALSRLPQNYMVAGRWALREDVFKKLKKEIDSIKPKKLGDIRQILEKYGVGSDVLEALGYKVKWIALNEDEAILEQK